MTKSTDQPVLVTPRLSLRAFELSDAPEITRQAGVWEIADTTLNVPHPYPADGAELWVGTHSALWTARSSASYAITAREGGHLVGAIGLQINAGHGWGEIGYWIGHEHWGRGFCTEAGHAVLALAFGALQLHRVQGRHLVRNAASGRVMTKLGMRLEGIHRDAVRKWDRFEDIAQHAILATDFRDTKRSASW